MDLFGPDGVPRAVSVRPSEPNFPAAADSFFGNCVGGVAGTGTPIPAHWLNRVSAALRALTRNSGIADAADDNLLFRAVRKQGGNWLTAGGSANAITLTPIAPAPAFASLAELAFVPLRFLATADNTAAVTLNHSVLGAFALTWADGTPLQAGDIRAGQMICVIFDGIAFRLGRDTPSFGSVEVFTASGAFTVKSTRPHKVTVVGGGASGASTGTGANPCGGGGGAGGAAIRWIRGLTIGQTVTVTVGAGGASVDGT
jgi:hypothetical protein